ncbi:post-GPI attachment to proteins factor 4 [Rhinophrynus dorsalis]
MHLSLILRSPGFHLTVLFCLTFSLAPLCFHDRLYSPLFSRTLHLEKMSHEFLTKNLQEGTKALQYFSQLLLTSVPLYGNQAFSIHNFSVSCIKATGSLNPSHTRERIPLAITIITVRRRAEFHYLLQVVRKFLDQLSACGQDCSNFRLLICNVDPSPSSHADACLLSSLLPSVVHHLEEKEDDTTNLFEREKQDYTFCLSRTLESFVPEYVMLIEDDAVPQEDIFNAFFQLVNVRFPKKPLGGGLYTKLYHPERLQGYLNPEPMRILEWLGLGSLAGLALNFIYTNMFHQKFSWHLFIAFSVYSMLLAELYGRHYLLELRRMLPALYNVVPATECCTPAMLFSEASARRTLVYLEEIKCHAGYAKDTALYKELNRRGEWAWALEPNMVRHIGMFSTLRGTFEVGEPQLL